MSDSQNLTIDFRCDSTDWGEIPPPKDSISVIKHLCDIDIVPEQYQHSVLNDPVVADAVAHGWYLYPPSNVVFSQSSPDSTDSLTPVLGEEYVRPSSESSLSFEVTNLDFRWYINIPEGIVVLVTSPLYNPDSLVVDQIYESIDGYEQLIVPLRLSGPIALHQIEPIIQLIPFSREYMFNSESDISIGSITDSFADRYREYTSIREATDRPYLEEIRIQDKF